MIDHAGRLMDMLEAFDYSGGMQSTFERLPNDALNFLVALLNDSTTCAPLLYFAIRLKASLEGTPAETRFAGLPEAGELLQQTAVLLVMERMRRRGEIEITKWPERFDDAAQLELRITERGRQRKQELEKEIGK